MKQKMDDFSTGTGVLTFSQKKIPREEKFSMSLESYEPMVLLENVESYCSFVSGLRPCHTIQLPSQLIHIHIYYIYIY